MPAVSFDSSLFQLLHLFMALCVSSMKQRTLDVTVPKNRTAYCYSLSQYYQYNTIPVLKSILKQFKNKISK